MNFRRRNLWRRLSEPLPAMWLRSEALRHPGPSANLGQWVDVGSFRSFDSSVVGLHGGAFGEIGMRDCLIDVLLMFLILAAA